MSNTSDNIGTFMIMVCCVIFCYWLVLKVTQKNEKSAANLEQRQEAFYSKLGKEFIIMKDTTIIVHGSYYKNEYTLSNNLTIDARLVTH